MKPGWILTGLTIVACSSDGSSAADARSDSAAAAGHTTPGAGAIGDSPGTDPTRQDIARNWVLTFDGVGPLEVGMTRERAQAALGDALEWPAIPAEGCDYGGITGMGTIHFLITDDVIGRVDIRTTEIPTERGIRIGDPEARIHERYGEGLRVEPHKYTDGHYVVVPAPDDSARRIVFETHADTVTTFRVGDGPVVDWVEGCS